MHRCPVLSTPKCLCPFSLFTHQPHHAAASSAAPPNKAPMPATAVCMAAPALDELELVEFLLPDAEAPLPPDVEEFEKTPAVV